ncbi:creatininase [Wielerella bovis]|uniref:creatininase n=1 Tax=Wielerella bovis TaxID=2917790 RepID=UPI002018D0C9|nr:creatininase [Wielerella bovis]ULJ64512.1 creatininase [Wielerella bovis]ULJ66801.1 creatininase [Wielerella bovis]ULJ69010.1 creatininase [Wielerella bovis]
MAEVNIMRIDAFSYREKISNAETVMLVPVGAVEQHGPHMPLGVDTILSTKMAELVAEKIDGLVAPTIAFGYKSQPRSGGGTHIVGTFGFSAAHVIESARTLVNELFRHGLKKMVFVNGHYENYQFVYEGVELALRDIRAISDKLPKVLILSYWDFVTPEALERLYPDGFPGWDIEHGGVLETSLMLEHFPDLVHMDRVMDHPPAQLTNYDVLPEIPERTPHSGCLSSAKPSSAEKGRILTEVAVSEMVKAIQTEFA